MQAVPIANRTWEGDFEIVYESYLPYSKLLNAFNQFGLSFSNISELWSYSDDHIFIQLDFTFENKAYSIWIERVSDYLNTDFLFLLNQALPNNSYQFETSQQEEKIFFLNKEEKEELQRFGTVFETLAPDQHLGAIIENYLRNSNSEHLDYAYHLLQKLNEAIPHLQEQFKDQPDLAPFYKQLILNEIIPSIDWNYIVKNEIEISNILFFSNS